MPDETTATMDAAWEEFQAELEKEGQEYERLLTEHIQKYEADHPESTTDAS